MLAFPRDLKKDARGKWGLLWTGHRREVRLEALPAFADPNEPAATTKKEGFQKRRSFPKLSSKLGVKEDSSSESSVGLDGRKGAPSAVSPVSLSRTQDHAQQMGLLARASKGRGPMGWPGGGQKETTWWDVNQGGKTGKQGKEVPIEKRFPQRKKGAFLCEQCDSGVLQRLESHRHETSSRAGGKKERRGGTREQHRGTL